MSLAKEFISYVSEIKNFRKSDWQYYICWIGMMLGLLGSVSGFLVLGHLKGVHYPAYVWNVPLGIGIFIGAIGIDTIGHQTRYRERLDEGEGFVHTITIVMGVTSVIALCLGYSRPEFFRIPALVLLLMSVFYSFVDEWMHWKRYVLGQSDPIEMWSHVFIFVGHFIMIFSWWHWFIQGYPGVAETLKHLSHT